MKERKKEKTQQQLHAFVELCEEGLDAHGDAADVRRLLLLLLTAAELVMSTRRAFRTFASLLSVIDLEIRQRK
jgi:hypothetical protein